MRRFFLPNSLRSAVIYLMLASACVFTSSAHAGWELLTRNPRGDAYYLHSNIVQTGPVSQVWGLVDLVSPIEKSASVKRLYEADCVKGKLRVAQKIVHTAKGGQGSVLSSDKKPGPWTYPDPGSVNEEMLLKICFEKKEARNDDKKPAHAPATH